MVKLLSSIQHSFPFIHCIYLSVSLLATVIDVVEQERKELPEPAPVEDTNPEQDQGKPWCILPYSLSFIYLLSYFMIPDSTLGHRSCIEALVA
jgi:hypothetical protein